MKRWHREDQSGVLSQDDFNSVDSLGLISEDAS